jgi:hypothetical protein
VDRAKRDAGAERFDDRALRIDDECGVVPVPVLRLGTAIPQRLAEADELAGPLVPVREDEVARSRRSLLDLEAVARVLVPARAVSGRDLLGVAEERRLDGHGARLSERESAPAIEASEARGE